MKAYLLVSNTLSVSFQAGHFSKSPCKFSSAFPTISCQLCIGWCKVQNNSTKHHTPAHKSQKNCSLQKHLIDSTHLHSLYELLLNCNGAPWCALAANRKQIQASEQLDYRLSDMCWLEYIGIRAIVREWLRYAVAPRLLNFHCSFLHIFRNAKRNKVRWSLWILSDCFCHWVLGEWRSKEQPKIKHVQWVNDEKNIWKTTYHCIYICIELHAPQKAPRTRFCSLNEHSYAPCSVETVNWTKPLTIQKVTSV